MQNQAGVSSQVINSTLASCGGSLSIIQQLRFFFFLVEGSFNSCKAIFLGVFLTSKR